MIKRLQIIIAIILGVITLTGLAYSKYSDLAKVEYVARVEQRLDQYITQDRADWLQEQIWKLQDRYDGLVMPREAKERLRRLERELEKLERKFKQ